MANRTERKNATNSPMYVVSVVMFVLLFPVLQFVVAMAAYVAVYGVPTIAELFTMRIPEYSHAVMWKERIWYSATNVGPSNLGSRATLMTLDPEKGDAAGSALIVPAPVLGLLADQGRLWAVATASVTLIEHEQATEFPTKRTLSRPCEPFLFDGQLAVIEMGRNSLPALLVFEKNDWVERGPVAIPLSFGSAIVNGKRTLVPTPSTTRLPTSLLDLQVVSIGGELHAFVSDGTTIAHRKGLEVAPTSALAPANVSSVIDLSNLSEWEAINSSTSRIGMRGKRGWKAIVIDGEPAIAMVIGFAGNPFAPVPLLVYRQIGGIWQKTAESTTPATLDFVAVDDGKKMYAAGVSAWQTLRFQQLVGGKLIETGVVTKAPAMGFQTAAEQFGRLYPWIFWLGILPYALGINRLINSNRDADYEFGKTKVELASFLRRGIARAIDHGIYVISGLVVAIAFGISRSQEEITKDIDKFFDFGPKGLLFRLAWMLLTVLCINLIILTVNCVFQGKWGITLGKWICGIRTVGTTLRPCGFLRALARELLLFADTLMGVTLIPAVLLMAFTAGRQRFGDLVADTVVIRNPHVHRDSIQAAGDEDILLLKEAL